MSLTTPPPDFPPEGFTVYDDILDAEEVFDDGTFCGADHFTLDEWCEDLSDGEGYSSLKSFLEMYLAMMEQENYERCLGIDPVKDDEQ